MVMRNTCCFVVFFLARLDSLKQYNLFISGIDLPLHIWTHLYWTQSLADH